MSVSHKRARPEVTWRRAALALTLGIFIINTWNLAANLPQPQSIAHRVERELTELRAAIHQSIPETGSVDRDEFLRVVTSAIGFSKLGKRIRSRINKAIAAEVRAGRLQTDWKRVWKVGQARG